MEKPWLIYNHGLKPHQAYYKNIKAFLEAGRQKGLQIEARSNRDFLLVQDPSLRLVPPGGLGRPPFVLYYDKDPFLARALEDLGLRLFNPWQAIAICDSKIETQIQLATQVPMPKTLVPPLSYFETQGWAAYVRRARDLLGPQVVLKPDRGSLGQGVRLLKTSQALEEALRKEAHQGVLLQEFVASSRGRDLRLVIVGDQVLGAIQRTNTQDFRANVAQGGQTQLVEASPQEKALALRAHQALGLVFSGVDLLYGPEGPLVCEVNSNLAFTGFEGATGIPVAKKILEEVLGRL
ncbi:MAG: RimK family alpha-L-glutamate ligase [Tissierellia bacterium]|nr:RimK family alpha-L-glutamate ligase [Tissierellia bacterium]